MKHANFNCVYEILNFAITVIYICLQFRVISVIFLDLSVCDRVTVRLMEIKGDIHYIVGLIVFT